MPAGLPALSPVTLSPAETNIELYTDAWRTMLPDSVMFAL